MDTAPTAVLLLTFLVSEILLPPPHLYFLGPRHQNRFNESTTYRKTVPSIGLLLPMTHYPPTPIPPIVVNESWALSRSR